MKWHGGKTYLARRIIERFGPHRVYCEPFAGGLSVLLNKPRSPAEAAGDLDAGLIGFYRVLASDPGDFRKALRALPYEAGTFEAAAAWCDSPDPATRAMGFLVRNRFSRGGLGRDFAWSERLRGGRPGDVNAWETILDSMDAIAGRLRGVDLVNGPAIDLVRKHDGPDTLFYVDPPYLPTTRTAPSVYRHEMTAGQHEELLALLDSAAGSVVLSGYGSPLYDARLASWERVEHDLPNHSGQGRSKQRRTECLWIKGPAAVAAR